MKYSEHGKWIAVGDSSGNVTMLDVEQNWKVIDRFRVHFGMIHDLHFIDEDRTLVSISQFAKEIAFTDVATRKCYGRISTPHEVLRFQFLSEKASFLTLGNWQTYVWHVDQ